MRTGSGHRKKSHPVWGAWIGIYYEHNLHKCRTPCGVRGLECDYHRITGSGSLVAPHTGCVD